jgi:hypothetical protein
MARPLSKLTGNSEWSWNIEQQLAFDELKAKIAEEVTLIIPREHGQFC